MAVLENFQAGPKHKRAKIKPDNDTSGNQLANTLLAILNNAVQRNWSDTKVAASMIEQLEPFVNHNDQTQDEWEESVGYAQGNQFHEDAMQFEPWQQGSYNEHNSWYYDNRPVSLLNQPRSPLRPMRHRRRLRGLVKGLRPRFPRKSGVLRRNLAQSIR